MAQRNYGFGRLLLDIFLTCITGGVWLLILLLIHFGRSRRSN